LFFSRGAKAKENTLIGWILQILSRLSQAEKPHEDLADLDTIKALINYVLNTKSPLPRAARVLLRLTSNLHCVMSFVKHRSLSWMRLAFDQRPTLPDSPCPSCSAHLTLGASLESNAALLAESGYAEGQMCHVLVRGNKEEKYQVAVSTPMLVRPRKLLRNILIVHEGLDVLIDVLEAASKPDFKEAALFGDAVLACKTLAGHVGVVAPKLKLEVKDVDQCLYQAPDGKGQNCVIFQLDDKTTLAADKEKLSSGSDFFAAMFAGGHFSESGQASVRLANAGRGSLTLVMHRLHGCRWCSAFAKATSEDLLDLVALTDQYLLSELNLEAAEEVVRRCMDPGQVVRVYERSLQRRYPVTARDSSAESSLAVCAVSYLLVGTMSHARREELFRQLMASNMSSDFADDVAKTLRAQLLEIH